MIAIAVEAIQWLVWGLCILLILPVLLNVPGKPEPAELTAYLIVLATVTGYPALLPALTILEWASRRSGLRSINAIRITRRVTFCCVAAVLVWLCVILFGPDPKQPVLTQAQIFENSYENAILWHDTGWMDRLMAEGASVDQPLSGGQTPAITSAEFGDWSLVVFLLGLGADPDRLARLIHHDGGSGVASVA